MESRPTPSLSNLSRYKPAILLITGLAAAYATIYLLRAHHIHEPTSPGDSHTSLRRSNAIHRRRRPSHRGEGQQQDTTSDGPSAQPTGAGHEGEGEDLSDDFVLNRVIGSYIFTDPMGHVQEVTLRLSTLPTADQLRANFNMNPAQADLHRNLIEMRYLDAFSNNPLPRRFMAEPLSVLVPRLRQLILNSGISPESMRAHFARSGGLVEPRQPTDPGQQQVHQGQQQTDRPPRLEDSNTVVESEVEHSSTPEQQSSDAKAAQSLLNLLYHIAQEQARREGYAHRGVSCNSCGVMPIRGIRYRCSNCTDYDLCESCETLQVHPRTHLFYKVRIPTPFLSNPREAQPLWYPGKHTNLSHNIPSPLSQRLIRETGYEIAELDAMWDQFKCLAASEWREDPNGLKIAIDRKTFNKCFTPVNAPRIRPPQLIYDRIFTFYDVNGDGLIGFEEFVKGLACLNSKNKDERLIKIYRGYDIDGDGYVDRKDFLRIFRAYYILAKEMTDDVVSGLEDDQVDIATAREVLVGSQPISSIFTAPIPEEGRYLGEVGKERTAQGDLEIVDDQGVVRESGDDTMDRNQLVAEAALRQANLGTGEEDWRRQLQAVYIHSPGSSTNEERQVVDPQDEVSAYETRIVEGSGREESVVEGSKGDEEEADDDQSEYYEKGGGLEDLHDTWPPFWVTRQDVESVLGVDGPPIEEIRDREIKWRILEVAKERRNEERCQRREEVSRQAIQERWRHRQFYVDEEEGVVPPEGYGEDNGGRVDDTSSHTHGIQSRPLSPRSRSSSKVRFQEDMNETRSNPSTSSRSIPFAERWGGYEIPEAEKDVGREILYQVTQQGLNEMLDPLFKEKEDLALEVLATRDERRLYRHLFNETSEPGGEVNEDKTSGGEDKGKSPANEQTAGYNDTSRHEQALLCPENLFPTLPPPRASQSHSAESAANTEPRRAPLPFDQSFFDNLHLDTVDSSDGDFGPEEETSDTNSKRISTAQTPAAEGNYDPTLPHHRPSATNVNIDINTQQPPSTAPTPAAEKEERYDPTIPYHRPNVKVNTNHAPPQPHQASSSSSSTTNTTTQHQDQQQATPAEPSSSNAKSKPHHIPSEARLARLAKLDGFEKEIKARGGPGRLNFQEFYMIMMSPIGARLQFLGSWIEMASF